MRSVDVVWRLGRMTIQPLVKSVAPVRVYGADRVPRTGGCVLAFNHFHWLDPPVFGAVTPRTIVFVAKVEAHRVPGLGQLIRSFGTIAIRRGESDRDAVRRMREAARSGEALGLFVEGTRQRDGRLGPVQPGAAMIALQENVPVVPAAIHGTETWRLGNWHPVSVAWGEPMTFADVPRGGKGYREASARIGDKLRELHEWLVELHAAGRPREATPPA